MITARGMRSPSVRTINLNSGKQLDYPLTKHAVMNLTVALSTGSY